MWKNRTSPPFLLLGLIYNLWIYYYILWLHFSHTCIYPVWDICCERVRTHSFRGCAVLPEWMETWRRGRTEGGGSGGGQGGTAPYSPLTDTVTHTCLNVPSKTKPTHSACNETHTHTQKETLQGANSSKLMVASCCSSEWHFLLVCSVKVGGGGE